MWLELINHRLSIDETIFFVQGLGLWLQDTADDMFVALSTKEIRQRWSSADHSANSGHARRHGRQTSCFQRFASLDRKLRGTNFPHVPFSLFLSKKFYYSQGLLDRWQTVWRPVQNHSRRFRPGTWQTLPRHRTAFRPIWQSCHDGWWSRCVLQRHFRHMHDTNQSQLSLGAGTLICLAKIRRNDAIVPFFFPGSSLLRNKCHCTQIAKERLHPVGSIARFSSQFVLQFVSAPVSADMNVKVRKYVKYNFFFIL